MSDENNRDDLPPWLDGGTNGGTGAEPPEGDDNGDGESSSPPPPEKKVEVPPWLKTGFLDSSKVGGDKPPEEEPELPSWQDEDAEEPTQDEPDLPDWVRGAGAPQTGELGRLPVDKEEDRGLPDWLTEDSDDEAEPEETPDDEAFFLEGWTPEFEPADDSGVTPGEPLSGLEPPLSLGDDEEPSAELPQGTEDAEQLDEAALEMLLSGAAAEESLEAEAGGDLMDALGGEDEPEDAEAVDLSWLDDSTLMEAVERTAEDAAEDDFFASLTAEETPTDTEPAPAPGEFDLSWLDQQEEGPVQEEPLSAEAQLPEEADLSWLDEEALQDEPVTVSPEDEDSEELLSALKEAAAPTPTAEDEADYSWLDAGTADEDAEADEIPAPVEQAPGEQEIETADLSWLREDEDAAESAPTAREDDPFANFDVAPPADIEEPEWLQTVRDTGPLAQGDDDEAPVPNTQQLEGFLEDEDVPTTRDLETFLEDEGSSGPVPSTSDLESFLGEQDDAETKRPAERPGEIRARMPSTRDLEAYLDALDRQRALEGDESERPAVPTTADLEGYLSTLPPLPADDESGERPPVPSTAELESFLAGLDDSTDALPQTGDLLEQPDFDIDDLFSDPAFDNLDIAPPRPAPETEDEIARALPDLLEGLEASVGTVSASAIIRQRKDRPLSELPERLKQLHERGEHLPSRPKGEREADILDRLLPGVPSTLVPTPIEPGEPSVTGEVALTREQKARVDQLRSALGGEDTISERTTAIDETYEHARLMFLEEEEPAAAPAPSTIRKRKKRQRQIDRVLIALVLAGAMAAPFYVPDLRIGDLPAATFDAASPEMAAFNHLASLTRGDIVLVAVEYGPTAAAELDTLTDALLRHVLLQGARPVLISTNPVGLLHASNIAGAIASDDLFMERLNRRVPLRPNRDYYVVQYLPGSILGLAALGANAETLLMTDIRGQATGLRLNSLRDFDLLLLVSDRGEEIRNYAEQVAPLVDAPLVLATGYTAAPLAAPYLSVEGIDGLLVGYRDAYTYANMIGVPFIVPPAIEEVEPDAVEPPLLLLTEEVTETPEPTDTSTPRPTRTLLPTDTPEPTDTREPTDTPEPTNTNTPRPSNTPEPTDTSTPRPTRTPLPTSTPLPTRTPRPTSTPEPESLSLQQQLATLDAEREATRAAEASPTQETLPTRAQPLATNTPRPTSTPRPTQTPTATPTPEVLGQITSREQAVNLRSGPGTNFDVVTSITTGARVVVLGRNEAGTWFRVRLEAGDEVTGWVWWRLVYIPEGAESVPVMEEVDDTAAKPSPLLRPYHQEATAEATAIIPADAGTGDDPEVVVNFEAEDIDPIPEAYRYRDERWYAMTAGIIVSSTIIAIGAAANIARGIARRRPR